MNQKAFTLIELLVVISIISLLSSVVFASLSDAREKARIAAGQKFESSLDHAIRDDLIGEWLLDECSGTTVSDTSGFGNDGTFSGSPPTWSTDTPNNSGCSLEFDGSSNYVIIDNNFVMNDTTSFTYTAWIKPSVGNNMAVFSARCSDYDCFTIAPSGAVSLRLDDSPISSLSTLESGRWYHVAVAYDYDSSDKTNSTVTFYIDGKFDRKGIPTWWALSNDPSWPGSGTHWIGYDSRQSWYFNGNIAQVRTYAKTMTSAQIQQLYAEGLSTHPTLAQN
jgi:prepilin-type N-terminal cleavage/methylation domain-containing protein